MVLSPVFSILGGMVKDRTKEEIREILNHDTAFNYQDACEYLKKEMAGGIWLPETDLIFNNIFGWHNISSRMQREGLLQTRATHYIPKGCRLERATVWYRIVPEDEIRNNL